MRPRLACYRPFVRTLLGPLTLLILAAGCAPNHPDDPSGGVGESFPSFGPDASRPVDPFASDAALGVRVDQVFSGCQGGPESSCHGSGAAGTHLRIGARGDLVNVASTERPSLNRVSPGDVTTSYLYLKVVGDGGIDGGRMPLGGPFDARMAPLIASWIEAGAPDP